MTEIVLWLVSAEACFCGGGCNPSSHRGDRCVPPTPQGEPLASVEAGVVSPPSSVLWRHIMLPFCRTFMYKMLPFSPYSGTELTSFGVSNYKYLFSTLNTYRDSLVGLISFYIKKWEPKESRGEEWAREVLFLKKGGGRPPKKQGNGVSCDLFM